ncbi:hypothetical protein V6N13_075432 [Hibiscus sabdariffa]|uniref:Uncharacterized protein n=1 Tax=Hibiscus sabdariffa TaxID=183260 RepID=A0ABR2UBS1_9ROSI
MGMASAIVHCTNSTDKPISYANNSSLQKNVQSKTRSFLEDAIKDMLNKILPVTCIKVADLGCASGPNAFLPTYEIMNITTRFCQQSHLDSPELQVFLNNLPHNDFNTVFRSVPAFHARLLEDKGEPRVPCFIIGVAGSFYQRLFSSKSIHFVHSSYCLHWLSKGLVDESDVDSFNMPYYFLCKEEDFEDDDCNKHFVFGKSKSGKNVAYCVRAVLEYMLADHFGGIIIDELFTRYAQHVGEHLSREKTKHVSIVLVMSKK